MGVMDVVEVMKVMRVDERKRVFGVVMGVVVGFYIQCLATGFDF